MTTHLLIDVSCLAYRNFYVMGDLSHDGVKTGVVFGLFRDILNLQETHNTDKLIFCFDGGYSCRTEIYSVYKADRKERYEKMEQEEREARSELFRQMKRLRTKYLPAIGFRNIFWQEGYEADDLIASVCDDLPKGDKGIIVSMDADLFQLLVEDRIEMWTPHKRRILTEKWFTKEWGIDPSQYADVKAIAGCAGDNVKGVERVGEKTAAKFLRGELNPGLKVYQKIVSVNDLWKRNIQLTRLPFPGTERFELREDRVSRKRWERVTERLGMVSLFSRVSGVRK